VLVEKHRDRVIRQSLLQLGPNQSPKALDLMTFVDGEFWLTRAIFMMRVIHLRFAKADATGTGQPHFAIGEQSMMT
jgi:hypothetical protein